MMYVTHAQAREETVWEAVEECGRSAVGGFVFFTKVTRFTPTPTFPAAIDFVCLRGVNQRQASGAMCFAPRPGAESLSDEYGAAFGAVAHHSHRHMTDYIDPVSLGSNLQPCLTSSSPSSHSVSVAPPTLRPFPSFRSLGFRFSFTPHPPSRFYKSNSPYPELAPLHTTCIRKGRSPRFLL